MTRVVVVRHGNTFGPGEAPRRIGARTDLPLVASGREQVTELAAWFAQEGMSFATVLSSPSGRCLETARLIAPDQPTIVAEWLQEIDHGPDEGMLEDDVVRRLGAEAIQRWNREALPPEDWIVDRHGRIEAWHRLFDTVSAPTLLVTSNGAARFALIAAGQTNTADGLTLRTGSIGRFEVEERRTSLIDWNLRPVRTASGFVADRQ